MQSRTLIEWLIKSFNIRQNKFPIFSEEQELNFTIISMNWISGKNRYLKTIFVSSQNY